MARRRPDPGLCRQRRGGDGLRAGPRRGHARGGSGSGAGRQDPVGGRPGAAAHRLFYDEERGLRDYDHSRLSSISEVIDEGRKRLADADEARALDAELEAGRGEDLAIILYVGHDGPAQGRDALLRQRGVGGEDRVRLRQVAGGRRDHRLPAGRLGRRPHLLLRPGDPGGALRELPGDADTIVEDRREIGTAPSPRLASSRTC